MKTAIVVVVLFVMSVGLTTSCGIECFVDQSSFDECYNVCNPTNHNCVSNCVNTWYCTEWTTFCAFGYYDHWGYCF